MRNAGRERAFALGDLGDRMLRSGMTWSAIQAAAGCSRATTCRAHRRRAVVASLARFLLEKAIAFGRSPHGPSVGPASPGHTPQEEVGPPLPLATENGKPAPTLSHMMKWLQGKPDPIRAFTCSAPWPDPNKEPPTSCGGARVGGVALVDWRNETGRKLDCHDRQVTSKIGIASLCMYSIRSNSLSPP
jgi:hypothetical protein